MTLSELYLYILGCTVLVLTPGPVVVAVVARSASRGVRASVPLALGVSTGDLAWPLMAVFGLVALVNSFEGAMLILRFGGAAILLWMGLTLLRSQGRIEANDALSETGWAGYLAGLGVILGNPKAILYYLGVLPVIFDISRLGAADVLVICTVSAIVPFCGNMVWALAASEAGKLLKTPSAIRRLDHISGAALIAVGGFIALS